MPAKDGAVARIRQDPEHEERAEEDVAVDIDLDELDQQLRSEAIGAPITVKISGRLVHVTHANDWSAKAMRALNSADWDEWAGEVIEDPDELEVFVDANLRNYQMEAIAREVARQSRMNRGKLQKRSGSSHNGRRK